MLHNRAYRAPDWQIYLGTLTTGKRFATMGRFLSQPALPFLVPAPSPASDSSIPAGPTGTGAGVASVSALTVYNQRKTMLLASAE